MYNRVLGNVGKYKVVTLFPYQIQDVNNFIYRDHIPYKEDSREALDYARETVRRSVEGFWANDNGNHIWMPPKLYHYVNTGTVLVENDRRAKFPNYPNLRDNEWIFSSYTACIDGFSGFKDDPDFTCNFDIQRLENKEDLPQRTLKKLQQYCVRKDGSWKKFVDPWEYLTAFYLVENPREFSLGLPLYENDTFNGMTIGSRGIGKSFFASAGDCAQEIIYDGVKYYDDLKEEPQSLQFVGSSTSGYIKSFMEPLQLCIENFPGKGFRGHPLLSLSMKGEWSGDAGTVEKLARTEGAGAEYVGNGSSITRAVLLTNKAENVVSKRYRRIYIDEVGLQTNIEDIIEAGRGSLTSNVGRYGSFSLHGTGGNIDKILGTKKLFRHPKLFDIFSIPDYWGDKTPMGLFIPASYKDDAYKNENGNTDLMAATKGVIAERAAKGSESEITKMRLNFPLDPIEPFLSGKSEYFDKDAIIERIAGLEHKDVWKDKVNVYDLSLGKHLPDGTYEVVPRIVNHRMSNAITDILTESKTGELLVYEPPMPHNTEFAEFDCLYKVCYDPVGDKDEGSSQAAIIVWKGMPRRHMEIGEMANNIVAVFKGRRGEDGEGVHRLFMLLCLWYKCKGQYEDSVSGLRAYFKKHGLKWLLQPPPRQVLGKAYVSGGGPKIDSGVPINQFTKPHAFKGLVVLINSYVYQDEIGTKFKLCSVLWDLAMLVELNYYVPEQNFDLISALLILVLWLEEEYMPSDSALYQDVKPEDNWDSLADEARMILSNL